MALALNVFQTVTAVVSISPTEVYTAPVGYTGVVLLAQVANIGASSYDVTLIHRRQCPAAQTTCLPGPGGQKAAGRPAR